MTIDASAAIGAPSHKPKWHDTDWSKALRLVRRLQVRIVKAVKAGRWNKVKVLQRLLTHSWSAKLLAVRRVTENRGRKTPGVDGETWSTPGEKMNAVVSLRNGGYKPRPLRRVYIPKKNGKRRPLSIPCMRDRAMQVLYLMALEPIAECLADPNSYGFRKGRSTQDAIAQCFTALSRKTSAEWILEGDIKGCFDNFDHQWLETYIPMDKGILHKWLKSGYMEGNTYHDTDFGTPQGGLISPTLANMALDGLETILKEAFPTRKGHPSHPKVNFVRYADDFIITGCSRELLINEVKPLVESFLKERGLQLSPEKTRVTCIRDGFDFLGFNLRKYNGKLLIRPSKESIRRLKAKISDILSRMKTAKAYSVVKTLNPIIQGWGNYYRHVVSKAIFNSLDHWLWTKLWRWSRRRHGNKSSRWIAKKYFCSVRGRRWVFYGKDEDGARGTLRLFALIPIRRHIKIRGMANPYDPDDELYFESRADRRWAQELGSPKLKALYKRQNGKCLTCGTKVTRETGWNVHHLIERCQGGGDQLWNLALLHPECHRQVHTNGSEYDKLRAEMCVIKA